MCYYLYGTVEGDVNENVFNKLNNMKYFKFKLGTYSSLVSCIKKGTKEFRLTNGMCDCATAIGGKNPSYDDANLYEVDEEIEEYSKFIQSLTELRNIKNLYICKKYNRDKLKGIIELQIDDIDDLNLFFANIRPNLIYKIGLYKKYY